MSPPHDWRGRAAERPDATAHVPGACCGRRKATPTVLRRVTIVPAVR